MTTSTIATVYLEVDGKPHPASDCHWIEIAACGCISGSSYAESAGEIHTSGPDAFRWDTPKVVHEYHLANSGSTFKLITHQQFKDTYAEQMRGDCPHTPRWGIVPIPVPDGWTWMTTDSGFGRRTFRKHIVPADTPVVEGSRTKMRKQATALCGKAESIWYDSRSFLHDTIPCAKCVKVANDTSPALPGVVDVPTGDTL